MSEKLASGCNSGHTNNAASGAGSGIGGNNSVCIQTNKVYDACREGQCIGCRKIFTMPAIAWYTVPVQIPQFLLFFLCSKPCGQSQL